MKKITACVILTAMLVALFVPMTAFAADGELLHQVDWLNDKFVTVNQEGDEDFKYEDKYDLSNSTSDMIVPIKNDNVSDELWQATLSYYTVTGYKVTRDTKYTVYFEFGAVHTPRWSGVPFLYENDNESVILIGGALCDDGEFYDEDGNCLSQAVIAYDRPDSGHNLGDGYTINGWLEYHPQIKTDSLTVVDTCNDEGVQEVMFTQVKVEIDGTYVTPYYLDNDNNWVLMGEEFEYETEIGADLILGTYTREEGRHNVVRNMKLLQGTGLTLTQILTAQQTSEPIPSYEVETEEETEAQTEAQTDAQTEAQTDAQSDAQTDAKTEAQTDAETKAAEKSGCKSSVAAVSVAMVAALGCCLLKKKD